MYLYYSNKWLKVVSLKVSIIERFHLYFHKLAYRNDVKCLCSTGGDAKLLLMVCVSPTNKYVAETIKCLRFGSQARQISRGPTKSQKKHQQGGSVIMM